MMARDNNGIHEGAAMWLVPLLINNTAAAVALTVCLSLKDSLSHCSVKEVMLTTYVRIVNLILETFATDGIIAETDTECLRFTQPTNLSPLKYGGTLWMKNLRGLQV